jgi:3-hydroxyisobutyrate dehydrogenase-like beta-hydroxyacid dehydrogenase
VRVAVLGTGKMGAAMAKRLAEQGHDLTLWNRTRSRAEALGVGQVAGTPAEAAARADVVISMLTNADAVRSTYLGPDGAVKSAHGQVYVDMSTAGVDVSREIAPAVERPGAAYVEAPVLGSVGAILAGTAVVLAAGSGKAVDRAREVLEAFGDVRYIGPPGSAAILKLIGNSMLADVYTSAAELLGAGSAAGLPVEEVFFVLNRIAPALTQRKAGFVEHRYEPVTFALRDILKDLELATAAFRRLDASTPMTDATRELFERAAKTAADLEMTAINILYERETAGKNP